MVQGNDLQNDSQKVLETVWNPHEDTSFKVKLDDTDLDAKKTFPISQATKLTKHIILSKLAGIYNLIGGGAAVLVKPKIAMQELWQLGLG